MASRPADYSNLRENGLIRVVFALPANMRADRSGHERAVGLKAIGRHLALGARRDNVKLTGPDGLNPWPRGPNPSGGFQLDGRFLTLQEQALGALVAHAQIQSPPQQRLLDDLSAFQRVLFTNERVRALSEAVDAGVSPLPDADPPLNALELQGKAVFIRSCAQCHGGPGQSTSQLPVGTHARDLHAMPAARRTGLQTSLRRRFNFKPCPPRLARNARTYEITQANGTTMRRTSSDPGRALFTGFVGVPATAGTGRLEQARHPGIRGLRNTAPYFHNNSANTLEEVVDHYIEFFKVVEVNAPPGVVPPVASTDGVNFDRALMPEERAALLAYLRKL